MHSEVNTKDLNDIFDQEEGNLKELSKIVCVLILKSCHKCIKTTYHLHASKNLGHKKYTAFWSAVVFLFAYTQKDLSLEEGVQR